MAPTPQARKKTPKKNDAVTIKQPSVREHWEIIKSEER